MGVERNLAEFIVSSYDKLKPFNKVITLGRQTLMMNDTELKSLIQKFDISKDYTEVIKDNNLAYADFLFLILGSKHVASIDFSDYEGATILHDMNKEIPKELKQQFDLVFDGGTLEHIFNFPIALKNCLELAKVGGRVIICSPANNMCGHGFYQFSPELYFRVFSESNGFKIRRLLAVDMETGKWFNIQDPEKVHARVELVNLHPVSLYIEAERIADKIIFGQTPQQSDYVVSWDESQPLTEKLKAFNSKTNMFALRSAVKKSFPFFYDVAKLLFKKKNNLRDKRFYSRTKSI